MKFIKNIFTRPAKFNPGRRKALGAAAIAPAAAVGVKKASKRTHQQEKEIYEAFENSLGEYNNKVLPLPQHEIRSLRLKQHEGYFNKGETGYGFVDVRDYYKAGGTRKFVVAAEKHSDGFTVYNVLPEGWKPPANKITGKQASELFPGTGWTHRGNNSFVEFVGNKDAVDIMELAARNNQSILGTSMPYDKRNWPPVRPNIREEVARQRRDVAGEVRYERQLVKNRLDNIPGLSPRKRKQILQSHRGKSQSRIHYAKGEGKAELVKHSVESHRQYRKNWNKTYDGWE